jgi:hypothetical protein
LGSCGSIGSQIAAFCSKNQLFPTVIFRFVTRVSQYNVTSETVWSQIQYQVKDGHFVSNANAPSIRKLHGEAENRQPASRDPRRRGPNRQS